MSMLSDLFSGGNYVYWVELLSIAAVLVYLGYIFYSLDLFRKN